ncbi:cyclin-dependent kinase inhibitor 1-like isoform X2 [Tripterygium wilfordii]|uniref:cyclin-dependent kinase inhibitor 1-like isoform X2 n=1 Tax=Tripterygium wilfordii TaxID=458696 RepID=UPI0018F80B3C|nr:cyclin-dependent kinase inhibitor 1-like isoform X2 [Tripterygium wilfordii]
MVRKCWGITEISVMEVAQVGVRTRAQALAMAAATSSASNKRRKANDGEIQISTSYFQLGSTTSEGLVIKPENSASSAPERNSSIPAVADVRCGSPSSDHTSVSCCSSNGSSKRFKSVDPEDERSEVEISTTYYSCAERETTPTPTSELQEESGDLDSTAKPYEADSRPRSAVEKKPSRARKMPPESELEEFFAEAEKKLKQEFTEKYNFDVEKEEPLVGRYEWVRVDK